LKLPHLSAEASCPVSTVHRSVPKVAIAVGEGPVFAVLGMSEAPPAPGSVVHYETEEGASFRDLYAVKALWAVSRDHPGPVLLRGHQLDGPGDLFFQKSEGDPVEPFLAIPAGNEEWRYFPSAMFIGRAGCFGVQIDGQELLGAIVFKVVP
jgi:hypothetical protein